MLKEKILKCFSSFFLVTGDVQPIASQLIDLAKKNASSDNISVIVVFLKDPHQIVAEHKLAVDASAAVAQQQFPRMDFESTNGCHHMDDGLLATDPTVVVHDDDDTPSPDKMHVDFNKPSDVHHDAIATNDFYFGKNGNDVDEFHANINTITSNGDGDKFANNDLMVGRSIDDDHDDFGPETDVDATDDNAISPLSPSVSLLIDTSFNGTTFFLPSFIRFFAFFAFEVVLERKFCLQNKVFLWNVFHVFEVFNRKSCKKKFGNFYKI